jgi:hypothetical protein
VYALPFECYYAGTNFDILVHQDLDSDHNFTLDYLKVRQIAIESPTIPHLQTRWYSPLSGVSIRRTPEPPRFIKEQPVRRVDPEADAEKAGTIIIDPSEDGRRTLRPRPSLDPNDPLVCFILVLKLF